MHSGTDTVNAGFFALRVKKPFTERIACEFTALRTACVSSAVPIADPTTAAGTDTTVDATTVLYAEAIASVEA